MSHKDQEWWDTFSAALGTHLNEDYPVLDIPPTDKLFGVKAALVWTTDLGDNPEDPEVRVRAHVREFCLSDPSTRRIETSTTFATSVHIDPQDQVSMDSRSVSSARFVGQADSGLPMLNRTENICRPKITEMVGQAVTRTISELDSPIPFPLPEYARGCFEDYEAVERSLPDFFLIPTMAGEPRLLARIVIEDNQPVVYLPPADDDYEPAGFQPSAEVARVTFEAAVKVILGK